MTTPEGYERIAALFRAACALSVDEREAFLSAECEGESTVRDKVCAMLSAHESPAIDLDSPVLGRVGEPTHGPPASRRALPDRVGPYRIRAVLGEGGMGIVYRAEQDTPRREVALKLMRPELLAAASLRRFRHEAEVLGQLRHPAIVPVYDSGTAVVDGREIPFLAMERVEGPSLLDYACVRTANALPTRNRLELFRRICDGVHHAHVHGVVHRDLKPANILVTKTGEGAQPRILDFGIAKVIDADAARTLLTEGGQILGTIPYMSPEQLTGESAGVDMRADVYALGVILYELLSGDLPYDLREKGLVEAVRSIDGEDPLPLGNRDRTLRGDLETIAAKALERNPVRRYQSAAELASDVSRFLNDEPILARQTTWSYQLLKFARRNRGLVAGVATAFLTLALGVVVSTWFALGEAQQRREAVRQAAVAEKINAFLNDDLLALADPVRRFGSDGSFKTMLESASESIQSRFRDEPLVRASILVTLGNAHDAIGEHLRGERQLAEAISLYRTALGSQHPTTTRAALDRARVLGNLGRYDEAVAILDGEAVATGTDTTTRLRARSDLGEVLRYAGEVERAQSVLADVVARSRLEFGADHRIVATNERRLARALVDRGELDESEDLLAHALDVYRQDGPALHPDVLECLHTRAIIAEKRGNLEQARVDYEEALGGYRAIFGPEHRAVFAAFVNLGRVHTALGDLDRAEELLREALAGRAAKKETEPAAAQLASLYIRQGRFDDAEPLARTVLDQRRERLGPAHSKTLDAQANLAVVYTNREQFAEAASLLGGVLESYRERMGPTYSKTLICTYNLAALYERQERPSDAAPLYREALDGWRQELGPDHWRVGLMLAGLGRCLTAIGSYEEAASILAESERVLTKSLGGEHEYTSLTRASLTELERASVAEPHQ